MQRIGARLNGDVGHAALFDQAFDDVNNLAFPLAEGRGDFLGHDVHEPAQGFASTEGARGVQDSVDSLLLRGAKAILLHAEAGHLQGDMFYRPGEQGARMLQFQR